MDRSKIRTFIALNVPDSVKDEISRLQRLLDIDPEAKINWVNPSGVHLTLKFLGDADIKVVGEIASAIDQQLDGLEATKLQLGKPGFFGKRNSPSVLWVGVDADEQLQSIHQSVNKALVEFGFDRDSKKFIPHLTLGRVKSIRNNTDLSERLLSMAIDPVEWIGEKVTIMSSDLTPNGAIYKEISHTLLA